MAQYAGDLSYWCTGAPPQPPVGPSGAGSCLISEIQNLVQGPDGALYATANGGSRVIRIGADLVTIVAGNPASIWSGDTGENVPAIGARITAHTIAFAPDGSLYVGGPTPGGQGAAIRRVGSDGFINTISGWASDPNFISGFDFDSVLDLSFGPDGSLYVLHGSNPKIMRVDPTGRISAIAGGGTSAGEGIEALQTELDRAAHIAVDRQGTIYVAHVIPGANGEAVAIRAIGADGLIRTVAGSGACGAGWCGEGGPAYNASLGGVSGLHVAPDGTVRANNHTMFWTIGADQQAWGGETFTVVEDGGRVLYRFDEAGRHLETVDTETGATLRTIQYDQGRLESVLDVESTDVTGEHDGRWTFVERDPAGAPAAIVGHYGHRTELQLSDGHVTRITDPSGKDWVAAYEPGGLMSSWTDRNKSTTQFGWDVGRLDRHLNSLGGEMTLKGLVEFGESGHRVAITSPEGRETMYGVDRTSTGARRHTTTRNGLQSVAVEASDATRTVTAPNGTLVKREGAGDPRFGMTAPLAASTTKWLSSTDPLAGLRKVVEQDRSLTGLSQANKLVFATRTNTVAINGKTWQSVYDKAARTETLTSPEGRIGSITTYDAQGRVIKVEAPGMADKHYHYDPDGRLDHAWQGNRHRYLHYGPDGLVDISTDELNRQTTFTRDDNGRVLTVTRPDGEVVTYTYDTEGATTSVITASAAAHGFTFNGVGATEVYTPPPASGTLHQTEYTYYLDKKLDTTVLPDDRSLSNFYDAAGRLKHVTFAGLATFGPGGEQHGGLDFSYNPATGTLASATGPTPVTLSYAHLGDWLSSVTYSGSVEGVVAWTPDTMPGDQTSFRVGTETVNGAWPVAYGHDDDGLMVSAGLFTLQRSPASGRVEETSRGDVQEVFTYTQYGEVQTRTASIDGVTLLRLEYEYDARGRIESIEETSTQSSLKEYQYDDLDRVTEVWIDGVLREAYGYDENGNREVQTTPSGTVNAVFDAQDRLITFGNLQYTYLDGGQLAEVYDPGPKVSVFYQYDSFGTLRAVQKDGVWFTYEADARGRRVLKKEDGVRVAAWLWSNDLRPIAELDENNDVTKRFIYTEGVNSPELMVADGKEYRLIKDHLGSVRFVVNVATGDIRQELRYDTWGRVLLDTNPGFQPFGFAGGFYDQETGLVRFGARDYDPETGRWLAKDPIGLNGGLNLYEYANSNPVNSVDPTGHFVGALFVVVGEVAVVVGTAAAVTASAYFAYRAGDALLDWYNEPQFPDALSAITAAALAEATQALSSPVCELPTARSTPYREPHKPPVDPCQWAGAMCAMGCGAGTIGQYGDCYRACMRDAGC